MAAMTLVWRPLVVALAAAVLPACGSKVQARTPPPAPPLEMPSPPGRVVIPVTVKVPEPPPVVEPAPPEPVTPPAGTPPARPLERTPPAAGPPTPVLQTTSDTAAIEKTVRDLVTKARADLARLDRRKLAPNARDQFDTARRFVRMAEEALAIRNYIYAQQLAESAAALAGALVKGNPAPATSL